MWHYLLQTGQSAVVTAKRNQFICSICSQVYKGPRNLAGHLLSKHGIGKPYTCECGQSFVWNQVYYKHRKTCSVVSQNQSGEDKTKNN